MSGGMMTIPERITRGMAGTDGHVFRYLMASGFLRPGDVALDAACGIGYGCEILSHVPGARCVGVDREEHADFKLYGNGGVSFEVADLTSYDPKFGYDLFVGFETIEHLPELGHYIGIAKRARRWVILSAPVVPTAARNPTPPPRLNIGSFSRDRSRVTPLNIQPAK